jgi:hypothetical protein
MMSGFFKAAWATQSVAALMLDFSNPPRSIANAGEAMKNATAIARLAGRYFDMATSRWREVRSRPNINIERRRGLFLIFVNGDSE